jgi:hypothetical protein
MSTSAESDLKFTKQNVDGENGSQLYRHCKQRTVLLGVRCDHSYFVNHMSIEENQTDTTQ